MKASPSPPKASPSPSGQSGTPGSSAPSTMDSKMDTDISIRRVQRATTQKKMGIHKRAEDYENCARTEELTKGIDAERAITIKDFRQYTRCARVAAFLKAAVKGCGLDVIMGFVILVNSALIGVETDAEQYGLDPLNDVRFIVMENVFLIIYIAELGLHIRVEGFKYCQHGWGLFDSFIVAAGCISTWVVAPLGSSYPVVRQVSDKIMIGRVARLLKLARAIRMMSRFKILWSMVRGLFHSLDVLVWTFVLMMGMLFLFAVMGVYLIGREKDWVNPEREGDEDYEAVKELAVQQFGTMFWAMLTLLQFMTLDSWIGIVQPIVYEKPSTMIYFLIVLLVCAIALMNLATAAIVNDALEASNQDKEVEKIFLAKQRTSVKEKLQAAFEEGDVNGDGILTKEELQEYYDSSSTIALQLEVFGSIEDIMVLYDIIDSEESGNLRVPKLLDGLCKYREDKHGFLLQIIHDQLMEEQTKGPQSSRKSSRANTPAPSTNNGMMEPVIKLASKCEPEPSPAELLEPLQGELRDWESRVESKIERFLDQAAEVGAKLTDASEQLRSHLKELSSPTPPKATAVASLSSARKEQIKYGQK